MNFIKGKKQRIVIIVSVVIILCGFAMIPLSQKLDGFPNNVWAHLGILMGLAGGGGIGAVISLHIISKRSKQKCNMNRTALRID